MDPRASPPATRALTAPRPPLGRRGRWIGTVIAMALLAGLGGLAWYLVNKPQAAGATAATARRMPPLTVGVATATRADLPVILEALGTVTPAATVRVQAQVSGVLKEVHFKEGQTVKAGDLLATIDARPFEMALLQATGQRQRDEAQLDNARLTLERFRTLLAQDSIARQEVDTQAALVKQLEGTINTDRASEGTARINLGFTRVVAPISGRVGLRAVDAGNVVGPGDANGIAVITQISPIDVEFAVPQDRIPEVQAQARNGTPLKAVALDRARVTALDTGAFVSLDNQVDVQTGTVRAKARFPNTNQALFPSQFVNLRLQVRTEKDAVVVPITALRLGSGGDYVYVVNADRTVSVRTVQRGLATADKVAIASGLQVGERVVTEGADRLKDGASVTLPGDAAGRPAGGASRPAGNASAPVRPPADGSASPATSAAKASGPATPGGPAAPPVAAAGADTSAVPLPTPEQRKRLLGAVKDDPVQLERRQRLLEAIDRGDPVALERWKSVRERLNAAQ